MEEEEEGFKGVDKLSIFFFIPLFSKKVNYSY